MQTQTAPIIRDLTVEKDLNVPTDLLDKSIDFDQFKVDYNGPTERNWRFEFIPDMRLMPVDKLNGTAVEPGTLTDHAFSQLLGLLGNSVFGSASAKTLPFDYLWTCSRTPSYQGPLATLMNAHLLKRDRDLMVRTYTQDDNTVRAIMSTAYAPVSNTKMLTAFRDAHRQFLVESHADENPTSSVVHSWVSPDSFTMKTIFYDVRPQRTPNALDYETEFGRPPYGIGVMLSNNEVGAGSVKVTPLIQRGKCWNTIIIDRGGNHLDAVHRGSPQLILDRVKRAIHETLHLSAGYLEEFLRLDEEPLPNFFDVISKISADRKWDVSLTNAVRTGAEGRTTIGALINGLTWAAHTELKREAEVDMEAFAGSIMIEPRRALKKYVTA